MSAHEIEDLVESSVRLLAGARLDAQQCRDAIVSLYRHQAGFDCGHISVRLLPLLYERRYLLPLTLREHPDAQRYARLVERIEQERASGWLSEAAAPDGRRGLCISQGATRWVAWDAREVLQLEPGQSLQIARGDGTYCRVGTLDCSVGSDLWRRLVDEGRLSGLDATAPLELSTEQLARLVVEEAESRGDIELISRWYAVFPFLAEAATPERDLATLRRDPDALQVLRIVARTRAFKLRSDVGFLKVPRGEDLLELSEGVQAFAPWWYASSWSLPPQRDRVQVVFGAVRSLRRLLEGGERPSVALRAALAELGEFNEWSSLLTLFQHGFGYALGDVSWRIKRVVDLDDPQWGIDDTRADAELALQTQR